MTVEVTRLSPDDPSLQGTIQSKIENGFLNTTKKVRDTVQGFNTKFDIDSSKSYFDDRFGIQRQIVNVSTETFKTLENIKSETLDKIFHR